LVRLMFAGATRNQSSIVGVREPEGVNVFERAMSNLQTHSRGEHDMRLLAAHFWGFHRGIGGIGLLILVVVLALLLPALLATDEKRDDKKS
jgi:hypothetical protein